MSEKTRKPLPPSPDVPAAQKTSIKPERPNYEAREGKKEEYKPQVPREGHHGHMDKEEVEGNKEEYSPQQLERLNHEVREGKKEESNPLDTEEVEEHIEEEYSPKQPKFKGD